MKRLALAALALAACKGKAPEQQPAPGPGTGTAAPVVRDATPAGFDCTEVGKRMGEVFVASGATAKPRELEMLFTSACIDDGWSEAASKCAIAIPDFDGADACLQLLAPYPMVALAARLRQVGALPFQDPATVHATDCEAATTMIGLAVALRAAKTAAAGASARPYTELFQALSNELGEMCTDQAWPDPPRTCLALTPLPHDLDKIDRCLDGLPDATRTTIDNLSNQLERAALQVPPKPTGGDDCAAVGDAMAAIQTLKAQRQQPKHPEEAKWTLDHLGDLRTIVVTACTEDAWPLDARSCLTGLALPDDAPKFTECFALLPQDAAAGLTMRTKPLEDQREAALGKKP